MDYVREVTVALDAARMSGEYLTGVYAAMVPDPDALSSVTTEADRQSQELILKHLAAEFPDDGLCAEEKTPTLQHVARRTWVVDPIDGTRGFVMKNGEFSVMIGLVEAGEVVVGVVLEPAFGRVTFAFRHGGCWTATEGSNPVRVRVTGTESLAGSTLVQSHAKGKLSDPQRLLNPHRVVETYSAGVKMAMVARGEVDLYVNTYANFSDWDICAGHVLITEAGGKVSEIPGSPITYGKRGFSQSGGLLASNGRLHDAAVAGLKPLAFG